MNDMYIIFEASKSCFSDDVGWEPKMGKAPYLLTNNLALYRKFLSSSDKSDVIDTVINLFGMEHLIPIMLLEHLDDVMS